MLIHNQQEIQARSAHKRKALLRWLRDELFTTPSLAGEVMGVRGGIVLRTLSALEGQGVIARHKIKADSGRRIQLVGITAHGQGLAFDPESEAPETRTFEPSRVPLSILDHALDLQHLRLTLQRAGWRDWEYGDRGKMWTKGMSRPDAIVTTPSGARVAIECERTIKTMKRYEVIISDRLQAIKQGKFTRVIYTSPTTEIMTALRAVMTAVDSVAVAGQRVTLEQRHRDGFCFTTYDTLQDAA